MVVKLQVFLASIDALSFITIKCILNLKKTNVHSSNTTQINEMWVLYGSEYYVPTFWRNVLLLLNLDLKTDVVGPSKMLVLVS